MDEYERIEEELSQVYGQYVVKIRCLAYLEEQLEELERAQKIEFNVRECVFFLPEAGYNSMHTIIECWDELIRLTRVGSNSTMHRKLKTRMQRDINMGWLCAQGPYNSIYI